MAGNDGTLNFDTKIDSSGFQKGLDGIGGAAQKGLSVTSKVLGGAATAVTALGGAAIKVGSDFEAGMSEVQAVSGASGEALEQLKEKAKEMGAKTKFSATESAEAMNYMAMAGWKTKEMLGGIEGIMNLAAASGEDLATTSDIVTDALTAFGMSDSTHFADILAAASSNANTNVGLMGETFKYVAPLAGSLGYSAEDTATAIGLMANAGIKGSQAGTSLRSIMTRLAKPTKESQAAMDALGLSITDSSGKMKPLSEIVGDMRKGFSGLTEDEKASYAAMLGGQEAMSGLLAIVNASDKDFEKLSGAINDCNGSAAEMAEIMQDNLQGQITILQSGLEGLGVSLYETMQDTAKDVVKEAQGMVQQLQDAFNEGGFQGLVGAFGNVLAQIVQRIAEAAPTVIEAAVSLVMSFCDGLKSAPGIGESGASLITSLVTGLMSCVGEIWTTAIVLIGKLAEGIAAGAPQMVQAASTAITDIVECIVDWMPDILQAGADIIVALAEGIAGALPTLIYQAAVIVSDIALALVENLPALVDAALQLVMGLVQGLVDGIPVLLEGAIQLFMAILDALPVIIEKLLQALPDLITTIIDFFTQNIPLIVDGAIQLLMGIIDAIPTIIQAIVNNLPQIITALVNGLVGALPQLLEAAITLLMAIIEAIPDIVVAIAENLPQIITAIATGLAQAIPQIFTAAKDLLWQIIEAVPEIVVGIAGAVPDIIAGIVNGLIGGISAVWDAACELGSGILDGIKSFFGINSPSTVMAEQGDYLVQGLVNGIASMPAELAAYLDQTVQKIIAWGQQMFSNVQNIIQNVVNTAVNLIAQLPGKIWTWLVNVVTKTVQWGQQMLTTATNAIQSMISSIISLLSELPGKVWTWLVNVVTKVTAWGQQMLNTAKSAISSMISAIVSLISELPGKVWTWLVNTVTKVTQWGQQMLSAAKTAISNMISSVVSLMSELPGKVWTWLVNTVTKVTAWGQQMLSSAKTAITNMISSIVSLMSELPGKVATHLSNVVSKVVAWGSELASKGAAAAKGLFDAVVNGVSGLPSKMAEVGSNIVSGIWNGISSGWNWLKDKVSSLANSLLDAAKDALGINSPSKAFRDEFGRWLMPGTVEGVKQSMPKTLREMEAQAGELLAAMQGTVDASMNEVSLNASSFGDAKALNNGGTTVYNDNHQEQENNYHVPVATPAETAKAQREAFRKMAGGVK
ncbi:hypothetical protein IMSAGC003_00134 [Lachnospiraceae bacterium]|nr:hypothetical protein IMSAGC003_00134 [Lachnospiraceae bacterium]